MLCYIYNKLVFISFYSIPFVELKIRSIYNSMAGIRSRYLFLSKCLRIRHPLLATRLVEDAACLSICLRISSN